MHIGVNALYLIPGGVGGTEIYLRNLLTALAGVDPATRYSVIVNRETAALAPAPMRTIHTGVAAANRPARILFEQTELPFLAHREGFDVLFNPGFTAPAVSPCPQVTVFHDLQHKRHPENFRWFDLPFWTLLLWQSANRSQALIADSESTRDDLERYYGLPSEVIGLGVEQALFDLAPRRAPGDFFLCVSTLHPHKGIVYLVRAFAEFRRDYPQFRLVLAGIRGFAAEEIETEIEARGLRDSIEITGWIPRERLLELYRTAFAAVYPSTFEGFGIPVAEALAAQVPLACSDIDPLRGIAGGAALLATPGDVTAIAHAMRQLAGDDVLRQHLVAAGALQAERFSWNQTALLTRAVLERVARRPTRQQ